MAGVDKMKILQIYKSLLRESEKFTSYNFRNYAIRRVRDAFKENRNVDDAKKIQKLYKHANDNLNIIKRQVLLSQMYGTDKLVIENMHGEHTHTH